MTRYYFASNVDPIINTHPLITTNIKIKIYRDIDEAIKDAEEKFKQDGYCFVVIPAIKESNEKPTLYTTYDSFMTKIKEIKKATNPDRLPPLLVSNDESDGNDESDRKD